MATSEGNLHEKIKFTASTPPENRAKVLNELLQDFRDDEGFKKDVTLPEYQGTPEEEQILTELTNTLRQKLLDLGLAELENLLPNRDQIIIQRTIIGSAYGGWVDGFGRFIIFDVPEDMEFADIKFKQIFFHEIKHFLAKRIINAKDYQNCHINKFGLGKTSRPKENEKSGKDRGIFEEPNAELFSIYCCNEDTEYETSYTAQVPLLIAFIDTYAQRANITPIEAFRVILQSDIKGNQMIYKELNKFFSTETLRDMNNVEKNLGMVANKNQITEIAKAGGFAELYFELVEHLNNGESITLPGIKGKIKASAGEKE